MRPSDVVTLGLIALVASLGTTAVGATALFALRRARLRVQLTILVATVAVAIVASMVVAAQWMIISAHDLEVVIAVACIAGVFAVALSFVLGTVVSRNFRGLTRAARDIGEGRPVPPSSASSAAELRGLATQLELTSARLAESYERERQIETSRRELIAGISHDLRTPLAGIRAMSEALEDGLATDHDLYLQQMRAKVEQLSELVDDLFELSKIEAGMLKLSVSDVSLYDLVSDAIADLGAFATGRSITVEAPRREDLTVRGDARELSRAINNLLLNAVQHTEPGTPITVIAGRSSDGRPRISVIDQGGGIREDELERVFEAGWRGTAARSPLAGGRTAGAGLGLAIVAGIVKAHAGEATVQNIDGGCRFDLLLPA